MADNLSISTAGGDETIGADEISSVKYPRNKLIFGADGANSGDVQLASTTVLGPLPVNAYPASDYVLVAGLAIAVEFGVISLTATGTLETPSATTKIRVLSLYCVFNETAANEIYTFKSGAAGTAISGAFGTRYTAAATGGFDITLPFNPAGWFETATGTLLELSLAGTTPIAEGMYTFIQV
jgi:hypothetical protein